jgi:hypothetical protein
LFSRFFECFRCPEGGKNAKRAGLPKEPARAQQAYAGAARDCQDEGAQELKFSIKISALLH